jgi:probable HAF family extracellular repeat protein
MFLSNPIGGETLVHGESYVREANQNWYTVPVTWRVLANGSFADPFEFGLPSLAGYAEPSGFNDLGIGVGKAYNPTTFAYVFVPGIGYSVVPDADSLVGINSVGQIVGRRLNGGGPAIWQLQSDGSFGVPKSLGTFEPSDINDFGVMAGHYTVSPGGPTPMAVAWFVGEELQVRLNTVSLRASSQSGIGPRLNNCAIDDAKLAVVSTSWVNDQGEYSKPDSVRGMVWRPNDIGNEFTVLGTLGSGTSNATDVNSAGDVVGYSDTKRNGQHAFIFRSGVMTDLNAISPVGSRTLQQAWAINDDGEITGFMRIPKPVSEQRAFLLRLLP